MIRCRSLEVLLKCPTEAVAPNGRTLRSVCDRSCRSCRNYHSYIAVIRVIFAVIRVIC